MPDRRAVLTAWSVSAVATSAIMAPLWRPGYLLYRDAVSTPRTFLTDSTLGIGGTPPRAVPQDGLIAVVSTVVDGGAVVVAILTLSLLFTGVGYGLLAARVVGGAGAAGVAAASMISLWNPFVAERLLQGHWSLFTAYAALGWILLSALRIRDTADPQVRRRAWVVPAVATLAAALTPSGWLLATLVVVVALTIPLLRSKRWSAAAASLVPTAVGMLPWVTAVLVGSSVTTVAGASVQTFAVRAETGLGRLLTTMSLGGMWNADAVPASRQSGWAAVASALFIVVAAVGIWRLWRTRSTRDTASNGVVLVAAGFAAMAVAAILLASAGPGMAVLRWMTESVGGAGLLRDTTKFAMLVVPLVALAAAAFVEALRRWVPAGFAVGAVALLVVAPLPDLAWGVGGRIAPISYPAEWRTVTAFISADNGAVALWPGDTVRRWDFTDGPSLDPTARMVRAPVVESGELRVDGVVIDTGSQWAGDVHRALATGDDLRALGIGWVLASAPVPGFEHAPVYRGPTLTLYRIDSPSGSFAASGTDRTLTLAALWLWLGGLVGAMVALGATYLPRRGRTSSGPRAAARNPRVVDSHE